MFVGSYSAIISGCRSAKLFPGIGIVPEQYGHPLVLYFSAETILSTRDSKEFSQTGQRHQHFIFLASTELNEDSGRPLNCWSNIPTSSGYCSPYVCFLCFRLLHSGQSIKLYTPSSLFLTRFRIVDCQWCPHFAHFQNTRFPDPGLKEYMTIWLVFVIFILKPN